jgi:hypothetical protein
MSEPLKELSLFAFYWAKHFCAPECRLYHQNWSITRLIQNGHQLPRHADFFIDQISKYHAVGHKKILISGAADTGLLAMVHEALLQKNIPIQDIKITLIDRCATVIEQNKLFAKTLGLNVQFICGDILASSLEPHDIIIAHHFINFFDPASKPKLFKKWFDTLTNHGVTLVYNHSTEEANESQKRKVDFKRVANRLKDVAEAIEREHLPADVYNSIEMFMHKENVRIQPKRKDLMTLIELSQLTIAHHTELDESSSPNHGPTASRLGSYPRSTHLLVLSKS